MISIVHGETDIVFADPENPSTNFVAVKTTEPSLFEKGIIVGQQFIVNEEGNVTSLRLLPLTSNQIAALSPGDLFKDEADGHLKWKTDNGSINITG